LRNMAKHAEQLSWAASWFRFLMYLSLLGVALGIILGVIALLSGRTIFVVPEQNVAMRLGELLRNIWAATIGALVSAFLWRVGFIVCSFLSDFASGLAAQQIRRERQEQNKS
jgi:hypothetical protein